MLTEFHINKMSINVVNNQLCLLCFLNPMYLTSGGKCGSDKDQLDKYCLLPRIDVCVFGVILNLLHWNT